MAKAVLKSCNDSSGRTQMINSSLPALTVFSFCLAGTSWPKASLPAGPRWLDFCRHPPCCTLPEKKALFFPPVFSFGVRSAPPTAVQQKWNLCRRPEKTRLVTWRHLQETKLCEIQGFFLFYEEETLNELFICCDMLEVVSLIASVASVSVSEQDAGQIGVVCASFIFLIKVVERLWG